MKHTNTRKEMKNVVHALLAASSYFTEIDVCVCARVRTLKSIYLKLFSHFIVFHDMIGTQRAHTRRFECVRTSHRPIWPAVNFFISPAHSVRCVYVRIHKGVGYPINFNE